MKHFGLRIANRELNNPRRKLSVLCRCFNPQFDIRNPKLSGGFTLIDALVFIVIAGILLPAIVVPFATAVKGSVKPEMVNTAMYLAQQKMEEMVKLDYATLNPVALTPYVNAPAPGYQWQWEIRYVPSNDLNGPGVLTPDTGYKRIFVRVSDPENDTYEIYSVVTRFP
jgi:type II secretory pathway pseudopilin PulG